MGTAEAPAPRGMQAHGLSKVAQAQSGCRVAIPSDSAQSPGEHAVSVWGAGGDQEQRDGQRQRVFVTGLLCQMFKHVR